MWEPPTFGRPSMARGNAACKILIALLIAFAPSHQRGIYLLFVGPDFYSTCYVLRRVTNLELPQVAVTLSCSGREQAKLSTTFITDPGIVPGQREPTDFAF